MTITFGSLFAGIGGIDLGLERAGMVCKWQCEIDIKCQEVLSKRFGVKIYNDVRSITRDTAEPVDLICGGFPCQDVSIAGKRKGLAGERSGLWFEFARIVDEFEPKWVVIENVPGLLSSDRGRDYATVIRWLADRGYCVAGRVLDAQYFGVAQRRRRVFIVGSFGSGRSAKVLLESEGVCWDPPARGKTGQDVAGTFTVRSGKDGGGKGYLGYEGGAMTLGGQPQYIEAYDIHQNDDSRKDRPNGGFYINRSDTSLTIQTGQGKSFTAITEYPSQGMVARCDTSREGLRQDAETETLVCYDISHRKDVVRETGEITATLAARMGTGGNNVPLVGVRRLTPTECARLQGFPDDWNDWLSDSTRYKQFGNAVCVNVAEWIGKRIMEVSND